MYLGNTQMEHLCQEGLAVGAIIDPPRLFWSIYAYDPDGFVEGT